MSVTETVIKIKIEGLGEAEGKLMRQLSPRTINAIIRSLPIEGMAAIWKEEIYFEIPVTTGTEKATAKVERGTLAYWPMGSAFCIFYGDSQPYSPVNIIGQITKNLDVFKQVKSGTRIVIQKT